MTDTATTAQLVDQLEWHWTSQLRPRLDGLTDAEYLWEPATPAWSIRPRGTATSALAAGADAVIDFAMPEPDPPPVTTIAWRMAHIAVGVFGMRVAAHFGGPEMDYASVDWPLTADGGLALLDDQHDAWVGHLRDVGDDRLWAPCGRAEMPFAEWPFIALVLHLNREAIHHGAEIALLRDLYRATGDGTLDGGAAARQGATHSRAPHREARA